MSRAVVFTALLLFPGMLAAAESQSAASRSVDCKPSIPKRPSKSSSSPASRTWKGKAKVSLLDYQAAAAGNGGLFKHLRKEASGSSATTCGSSSSSSKGKLTVGYGSPKCIGPELEFGTVVGDHYRSRCCSSRRPGAAAACTAISVRPAPACRRPRCWRRSLAEHEESHPERHARRREKAVRRRLSRHARGDSRARSPT